MRTVSMIIIKPIITIIIIIYVLTRCRRAIGEDVDKWHVIGAGLSKRKQSRDWRLIGAYLSKCKQVPSGAAQRLIRTCCSCPGDSGRLICVNFTCPGGTGEGHIPTTYETGWVRSMKPGGYAREGPHACVGRGWRG